MIPQKIERPLMYLDIETEPETDEVLNRITPDFDAPSNYKDPQKILDYIEAARAKWREKAALSAITGRVLAVTTRLDRNTAEMLDRKQKITVDASCDELAEVDLIARTFDMIRESAGGSAYRIYGFGIAGFDIPFLVRRAFKYKLPVPHELMPSGSTRFYLPRNFIDLRDIWGMGEFQPAGTLDEISDHFGLPRKPFGGGEFAAMWYAERAKALAYVTLEANNARTMAASMIQ